MQAMTPLWDDLRYCARLLTKAPGTVLACVLSLSLGVGATTAVFSFVDAIQFKPLPVRDEATLMTVSEASATDLCEGCAVGTSYPAFRDLASRVTTLESLDAYTEDRFVISGGGEPERIGGALISAGLFRTIGLQPALGRDFAPGDDRAGGPPVVVISDALWRRRFAADPAILGRPVKVNGVDRTIVGVMPPRFAFPEFAQLWLPLAPATGKWKRDNRSLGVVGRLRPGNTVDAARAEIATIGGALAESFPEHRHWTMGIAAFRDSMTSETAMASTILLGSVAFVLLIACANVANLLLVRASDRRRELAIRSALGASTFRIVRLVLTESLALALAGGTIGVILAFWISDVIVATFGSDVPYWIQFGVDARVLLFGLTTTIVTGLLCGLVPALQSRRPDVNATLRDGGTVAAGGHRFRSVLAAAQLALALVLLAGAGLLVKTTIRTFRFDPGFDVSRVVAGDIELSGPRYRDDGQVMQFGTRVIESMERIPGVRAAVTRTVFFRGFGAQGNRIAVEGVTNVPVDASPSFYHGVTTGYFTVLGLAMRAGRDFAVTDVDAVIVNTEMARRVWGDQPALGHRIRFGDSAASRWFTVIGVVEIRGGSPLAANQAQPVAYVPFAVASGHSLSLVASSDRDSALLMSEAKAAVTSIDADQPLEDLMTMGRMYAQWSQPARFVALLMGALSGIALLMASMGTFGVVAYAVSRRTREIGIRLALGATPREVQQHMANAGLRLALVGLVLGVPAAVVCTRALEGILAGTSPGDPVVFSVVSLLLASVAGVASWLPARRAARVDPIVALRAE